MPCVAEDVASAHGSWPQTVEGPQQDAPTHLAGPAFFVLGESCIEALEEDGRIDVFVAGFLFKHLPCLGQLHAFDFE